MSVFNEALEWEDHAEQIDVGRNVMAANSGAAAADDRLDLNTGKGWSEMDLFDLAGCRELSPETQGFSRRYSAIAAASGEI